MLSLEQRIIRDFEELKQKKPNWADALLFSSVIYRKGLKFASLKMLFEKLVDKADYAKSEKDEVLQDYYQKTLVGFE